MASLSAALEFLSLPSACPLCVVALNPQNGQAIAINSTFESIFGPLYKFQEWDFANAATDDDVDPTAKNAQGGDNDGKKEEEEKEESNRAKFRSAIAKVRASLVANSVDEGTKAAAAATTTTAKVRNIEMLTLGTNESGLPVRHHFDWTIGSVRLENGDGAVLLYGDMVNELESKDRARDAELIDFFQNAPIAMHWLNGDGTVLWANQTELNVLGYTAEEYIGKPIMNFCPDEEKLVLEIFKQLGSGNAIADVPVRFRTKDGKMVHLLIDSNVAYNKDGSFGHTRCFIRDDTARKIRDARSKLLLEETERSLRMLDGFLSRTLHHVMGPLHALRGTCEVVRDRIVEQNKLDLSKGDPVNDDLEKNYELLTRAADTVMTTTRMVADVSDLARFDEGAALKTKFEAVNLRQLGMEAIENLQFSDLRTSGGDDGISVRLELVGAGGSSMLSTDKNVLLRVLAHLLENSVREVDSGGMVVLRITSRNSEDSGGPNVLVEIIDDGKGLPTGTCLDQGDGLITTNGGTKQAPIHRYAIGNRSSVDPDEIQKARAQMEEQLRDLKQNGVGVGLPLSYHLVRALGGDLRHDIRYAQKGTRIWFALPQTTGENKMEADVAVLKSETISKAIQPPLSITLDVSQDMSGRKRKRRISEPDFANFSSDGSVDTTSAETTETVTTVATPTSQPAPEAVAKCGVKASMPFSVLIVEDTDICARLLAMQLKKMKCSSQRAENGKIALDILRDSMPGTFDLVLMDLRMPVMDGLEATKLIRADLKMSIPVVALTGEMSADIQDECKKIGFDGFFQKPVKKDKLQELVSKYKSVRDGVQAIQL